MKKSRKMYFTHACLFVGTIMISAMVYAQNNVGIGTATPQFKLDIRGSNPDEGALFALGNSDLSHRLLFFGGRQNDPSPFIQWKDGDPLRFATDAGGFTEWMRVNPNGDVGIGITTPAAKLDISTSMRVLGSQGSFRVHPFFTPGLSTTLLATMDGFENGPQMRFESTAPGYVDVGLNGAGDFVVEGNDVARLAVTVGGNVGIGTATPAQRLHVTGNAQVNGNSFLNGRVGINQFFTNITFNVRGAAANERILNVVNSTGASSLFSVGATGDVIVDGRLDVGRELVIDQKNLNTGTIANGLRFGNGSGEGIASKRNAGTGQYSLGFYTGSTQKMTIANNGNIGIGTTNPTSALHVETSTGQVYIRRTSATGDQGPFASYPLFVDGGRQGILVKLNDATVNRNNNFMMFVDANNFVKGRIEGFVESDYSPPNPLTSPGDFICYVNELLGPIPLDPISLITATANIATTIACLDNGVTYASGFGDYAESLEMENPLEKMTFGDIVGVRGGKISKNTVGAEQIMAISMAPIMLGNTPPHDSLAYKYQKVAFLGQVPVKVSGPVKSGDFIVISGNNDGIGYAVSPDNVNIEHMGKIVGRSWETSNEKITRFVKVVVGLKGNEVEGLMRGYQAKLQSFENSFLAWQAMQAENQALKQEVTSLKSNMDIRIQELEEKMNAINTLAVSQK